ncbi:MFS transporter [Mycolicibacterium smegmatis]|uniref:Transporter, major facilitator family protein n=2 Tax=Mycolicibacterium smegmatis TaxID=1772 RepID=A0R600_MYCS2|nr:MFS transporter [Mycolicibacterium smegmatis]ABK74059.1 transporter, major facilitator family protein [Mycolicibacterium smegmatis MC2 155]AIU11356.1 membrane protein [Mycolicibacterium smegmatis MC2 155]AIU17980.1 membrane protein [Mycolicibacterium smegmatis]AIU24604.1 membrane protein [Mycolicibacterium smegmatis]MBE9616435.1 MFS transporter [Mycolicibacterium smegmatis]
MDRLIFRRLMPLLIAAYIIAFIDRTNIGLAKHHLEVDLGISAAAYGLGAGLFFLAYSLCEVPSNLIMHRVGARIWIARIMATWGLLSAAMAFVQGPASFYVLRILLGAAEAGLFPGVMLYLTYWFGRDQLARANGAFLVAVCLANIVGAPVGGALLGMDGVLGWQGWQWMFVIEGIPAVLLAAVVLKVLPNGPLEAKWLDPAAARALVDRLEREKAEGAAASGTHSFAGVFRDKQILLVIAVYFTHQIAVYSLTYFLPGIIGGWGEMSDLTIGLLTALPWVAAAIGTLVLPRHATDGRRSRMLLFGGMAAMVVGFVIGAVAGPALALIGFCIAASTFFVVQSILFTVPASRLTGAALAGGLALVNTLGILGGFVGPFVMGLLESVTDNPGAGLWFVIALLVIGTAVSLTLKVRAAPQPELKGVKA